MILNILLQAGGSGWGQLMPLLLVILVMYFFFFRPQMKKQKEEKRFQQEIAKGMRVVLNNGIHGKILSVEDNVIILESENSRLRVEKSAVSKQMSEVYNPKTETKAKADKADNQDDKKK